MTYGRPHSHLTASFPSIHPLIPVSKDSQSQILQRVTLSQRIRRILSLFILFDIKIASLSEKIHRQHPSSNRKSSHQASIARLLQEDLQSSFPISYDLLPLSSIYFILFYSHAYIQSLINPCQKSSSLRLRVSQRDRGQAPSDLDEWIDSTKE